MKSKKIIITLAIVALAAGVWSLWPAKAHKTHRKGVNTPATTVVATNPLEAVVTVRDIEETVDAAGFVRSVIYSDIKAEVSGKVERILVKDGQLVKKGDVLVELDPTLVKADEDEARRNVQLQGFNLEKATRDLKRVDVLRTKGFVSDREALDAKTAFEVIKLQLEIAQSRLDKASENLRKTILTAPHDGMVSESNNLVVGAVVIGAQSINSGTLLMRVSDTSILRVDVNLNEFAATRVELGREATITFDSIPSLTRKGKITFMAPFGTADAKVPDLRIFPSQVAFSAGDGVRPGISANVSVLVAREKKCVSVPVSGIFVEGNERIIYVKDENGEWDRRVVQLGLSDAGWTQVKKGVAPGETLSLVRPAPPR